MESTNLIVFDIGARYGIHPAWLDLYNHKKTENLASGIVDYYAFEVDPYEVERLKNKYKENYFIFNVGFSNRKEELELNLLEHKGQSSFLLPNLESNWFESRPKESQIQFKLKCKLQTLNEFCTDLNIYPNFLKIDTEGFDLKVLEGAVGGVLDKVLAINCEVFFEETFVGVPLFSKIFDFLLKNGFMLANLGYSGKGVPSSYFCPDYNKFGIISGCEAVFIKNSSGYYNLDVIEKGKLILYLFFNNLQDLSFKFISNLTDSELGKLRQTTIWDYIKISFIKNIKKLQYLPGNSYERAKIDFKHIFMEEYPEMHNFFENPIINP